MTKLLIIGFANLFVSLTCVASSPYRDLSIPVVVQEMYHDFHELKDRLPEGYPTENNQFWNSYGNIESGMRNQRTGSFQSNPGKLSKFFELWMTGYPKGSCQITLKDTSSNEELSLVVRNDPPLYKWKLFRWKIPKQWRERTVILHLRDIREQEKGWFGFSFPDLTYKPQNTDFVLRDLGSIASLLFQFVLTLFPGLAAIVWLRCKNSHYTKNFEIPILIAVSFTVAYANFYIFLFSPHFGKFFTVSVTLFSAITIFRYHLGIIKCITERSVWIPLLFGLMASLLIWSSGLIETLEQNTYNISQYRYWKIITPDSRIPHLLADNLYFERFQSPMILDWLSSDRPPLQASIFLFQRPFLIADFLQYHILGVLLQSFAITGALYMMLRIFRSKTLIAGCISIIIFNGLTVQNGFYVWPKLMAAGMQFIFFTLVFGFKNHSTNNAINCTRWILVGTFAGFSLLAHGGSFFPMLGMLLVFIFQKKYPKWRHWIIAGASFVALLGPWIAYQKLYDPPGNRLIKWHIAGVTSVDERGTLETIADSYANLTKKEWLENKWENLKTVFKYIDKLPSLFSQRSLSDGFQGLKEYTFGSFVLTNGPSGAVIVLMILLLRRKDFLNSPSSKLFWSSVLGILCWVILIFNPGSTLPHQGSYYLNYALMILGCLALCYFSKKLMVVLIFVNFTGFYLLWNLPQIKTSYNHSIYESVIYSPIMVVTNHCVLITILALVTFMVLREHPKTKTHTSDF
ncbi:MAG: hypothetical protein MI748_02820 [Opitutales bacterium]|nr:hypothetical protein [Opitutales bacterium]